MNFAQAKEYALSRLSNELSANLFYHSYRHTQDVCSAVEILAAEEGISGEELDVLRTGAIYHDMGYLEQYHANEPVGERIAKKALPEFDYTDEQIACVSDLIMATRMPQQPKTLAQKILCDADLYYLGGDTFYELSHELRRELAAYGKPTTLPEWYQLELQFLQSHAYFTETARRTQEPGKQQYIREIEELLNEHRTSNS